MYNKNKKKDDYSLLFLWDYLFVSTELLICLDMENFTRK